MGMPLAVSHLRMLHPDSARLHMLGSDSARGWLDYAHLLASPNPSGGAGQCWPVGPGPKAERLLEGHMAKAVCAPGPRWAVPSPLSGRSPREVFNLFEFSIRSPSKTRSRWLSSRAATSLADFDGDLNDLTSTACHCDHNVYGPRPRLL